MVEELIGSIKNAELKAEEDIKDSVREAREITRQASDDAEDILKTSLKEVQEQVKNAKDEGKQLAEEEYSKIMFDAHKECEAIKEVAKGNSPKAVEFILRGLYSKYGSR